MLKSQFNYFKKAIVQPIAKNSTLVLFIAGLVLVGLTAHEPIAKELLYPEKLEKLGWTILGAGIFTAIMKSAIFTTLFQNHIADVMYNPERAETQDGIKTNWQKLTGARVKCLLPVNHDQAVSGIEKRFFDDELEYHFENWSIKYEITIDEHGSAKINNTMETALLIPKNFSNPEFRQTVSTEGGVDLSSIIIDNKSIDLSKKQLFVPKNGGLPDEKELVLRLRDYAPDGDRIQFKRTFSIVQDLRIEPHITAVISRYITGATIHVKVPATHQVKFVPLGIQKVPPPFIDGQGFLMWNLAKPQELILPGQGYILVIVPVVSGAPKGGGK